MNAITLSDTLSIPYEALTQTFAILAKRGAGKSYTALVLAEEMFPIGQIVVIDPVGVCWGLRSSADGQAPGLPILVLGGEHGDVSLESASGEAIAEFVVESGQSAVLDLSELSGNQMAQFMTGFAERLYQLKAKNRSPLHLIIDEADAYAPQKPLPGEQRMLGAVDKIVRRGRARGLGVTLVTQRPAVISKNVLTQIEVLIALRTVAPQDRKAIEAWIEVHGSPQERDTLMASLPSLPVGTAWVWSPGWLNVFQQVQIRQRRTFDSSATPKVGTVIVNPKTLAAVDLTELQRRISATAETGRARDMGGVRYLKQRITELEQQLQTRVEVPVFQAGELERLETVITQMQKLGNHLIEMANEMQGLLQQLVEQPMMASEPQQAQLHSGGWIGNSKLELASPESYPVIAWEVDPKLNSNRNRGALDLGSVKAQLRAGEQKMLQTLAQQYPMKLTRTQLGTLSHFAAKGGTFGNYLSTLKRLGLVGEINRELTVTQTGFDWLGIEPPKPQTSAERLALWRSVLRAGERKMLDVLVAVYPQWLSRQELGLKTGYEATGGTFGNYLSTLRRNDLVTVQRGQTRACPMLIKG